MITGTLPGRGVWASLIVLAMPAAAAAQQGTYPSAGAGSPVCGRLEAQLAAIDRGGSDPARADQARRLEDLWNRQQAELDRGQTQWQRLGCQAPNLFSIFSNQPPQCGPLGNQIAQMRASIDRTLAEIQRTRRGADDDMQRQAVLGALAQNSCGPQYRTAAAPPQRGFLETLFGIGGAPAPVPSGPPAVADVPQTGGGGGYRTLCVRTCDGYYFPVSYSTSQSRFADDEQTCQKLCPAAEAVLYSQRGDDVSQAVSSNGRPYRELPNAFRYRKEFNPSCSCRLPGQSWAEALSPIKDSNVGPGDIVVTEEKAKTLAQPRTDAVAVSRADAATRVTAPRTEARKPAGTAPAAGDQGGAPADPQPANRSVRAVGPTFLPPR